MAGKAALGTTDHRGARWSLRTAPRHAEMAKVTEGLPLKPGMRLPFK